MTIISVGASNSSFLTLKMRENLTTFACPRKGKRKSETPVRPAKVIKMDSPMTLKTSSTEAQEDEDLDSIIDQLAPGAKNFTPDRNLDSIPTNKLTIGTPDHVDTPKVNTKWVKNCGSHYNTCTIFFVSFTFRSQRGGKEMKWIPYVFA